MIKANEAEKKLATVPGLQEKLWGTQSLVKALRTKRVICFEVYFGSNGGLWLNLDFELPEKREIELFGGQCVHEINVTVFYHERYGRRFDKFVRGVSGHGRTVRQTMRSVVDLKDQFVNSNGNIVFDAVVISESVHSPKLGRVATTYDVYVCPSQLCP